MDFFHKHRPVHVTLDSGATGNMIRYNVACRLGVKIAKTKHSVSQADGYSHLRVMGETSLILTRDDLSFKFDGLVVESLDDDVLGGVPFMKVNDIQLKLSQDLVTVNGIYNYSYKHHSGIRSDSSVRRTQATLLRVSSRRTVWPGDFMELELPEDLADDQEFVIEPRIDTKFNSGRSVSSLWPDPDMVNSVGNRIRVVNDGQFPVTVNKGQHIAQIHSVRSMTLSELSTPNSNAVPSMDVRSGVPTDNYRTIVLDGSVLDQSMVEKFTP